jgi:hypothetical protein
MILTDVTLVLIIVIVLSAVTSPVLVAALTGREARRRQQSDWERQDLVAVRARDDAEEQRVRQNLAATQAAEATRLLVEAERRRAVDTRRLEAKVDQVHILVNSKLTESMEAQAVALTRLTDLMTVDIARLGDDADPGAVDRRDAAVAELHQLRENLVDREAATEAAGKPVVGMLAGPEPAPPAEPWKE